MKIRTVLMPVGAAAALVGGLIGPAVANQTGSGATATTARPRIDCAQGSPLCTEVQDPEQAFGEDHYVGHDEPSVLFYSKQPGSGNRARYVFDLPKDPPPTPIPGRSYNFQLQVALWFGMAMCDTQSYPELVKNCKADSDSNIVDPAKSPRHPGSAFMEMQFYPPGWAPWPAGASCDATQWCAALNIDSYSLNPLNGKANNDTCLSKVGIEYVNFAFITKSGRAHAPASPVNATAATYTPDPKRDLFMNSGDRILVTMHDTAHGLRIDLNDRTSGRSGSMTASGANGFGQVKYAPNPSKECRNIPYDFHPMYSTSSPATRVPWTAHSYNIAFDDEIGHFDWCTKVNTSNGSCTGQEGPPSDREATDADDVGCFSAAQSTLVRVAGCLGTNTGFDGASYRALWPDGHYTMHPTPFYFSSPLTGPAFTSNYTTAALETDLPRITTDDFGGPCNRDTGAGCYLIPRTDDGQRATFYPFFSIGHRGNSCMWTMGTYVPGFSRTDFGGNSQWGPLLKLAYTGPGNTVIHRYNDFRNILPGNPCPAS